MASQPQTGAYWLVQTLGMVLQLPAPVHCPGLPAQYSLLAHADRTADMPIRQLLVPPPPLLAPLLPLLAPLLPPLLPLLPPLLLAPLLLPPLLPLLPPLLLPPLLLPPWQVPFVLVFIPLAAAEQLLE